uniref:Kinesin motor domain-containing protein n=1 Tax=Percolomonas cosmopolitus TaxID=63605 RepID=A0A7S1PIN9_9EUKA|eukprot:CAMPEP_0117447936 /NCGR_PEP_ID=MMETSP0759-20121206/7134_1 /TAXON_ID=63605 /ORGANISM="Percolomonas cosmopolitus, Strain WS" /LENGTH=918 /DNA_ID=CAMNT_0005240291 /DNA_START=1045 /DNA_END=3801 /DNA_ORIENTATION=+
MSSATTTTHTAHSSTSSPPVANNPHASRVLVAVRARPKLSSLGEKHAVECVRKQHAPSSQKSSPILLLQEHTPNTPLDFQKKYFFSFDFVFDMSASQYEIYEECVVGLVDEVLGGRNVTIMTYGQTGSGKTHTVLGNWNAASKNIKLAQERQQSIVTPESGLFIRCLADLFKFKQKNKEHRTVEIQVSILEIYNGELRDLLQKKGSMIKASARGKKSAKKMDSSTTSSQHRIHIQESGDDVNLIGLSKKKVETIADALSLYKKAIKRRAVAATQANPESSRSHALFFVEVYQQEFDDHTRFLKSKMCVCDLGGSEKVKVSKVSGQQLEEAKFINSSLSALGTAVNQMYMQNPHIPYRDSKLTHVLKGSFTGTGKILLIANISPVDSNLQETISTLRFADRVKQMRVDPTDLFDNSAQHEQLQWLSVVKMNERLLSEIRIAEIACQYTPQVDPAHLIDTKQQLDEYTKQTAIDYKTKRDLIDQKQRADYDSQVIKLFNMRKVVYDAEWEDQYATVKDELARAKTEHDMLDQTLHRSAQEKENTISEKKQTLISLGEERDHLLELIEEKKRHHEECNIKKRQLEMQILEMESTQKEQMLGLERSWKLKKEELRNMISQAEYEEILFNYVQQFRRVQRRYFELFDEVVSMKQKNQACSESIHRMEIINMSKRMLYEAINSVDYSAKSLELKKRKKMENDVLDQILNTTYPYDRPGIIEQVLDYLFSGTKMIVIGGHGTVQKGKIQTVFLAQNRQSVCYHDPGTSKATCNSFSLSSVREVILGQYTKEFTRNATGSQSRMSTTEEDFYRSFSIVGAKRTLSFVSTNTFDFEAWILGLEEVIDCRFRYGEPLRELGEHAVNLTQEEREMCSAQHIPAQVYLNCKIFVDRARTRGKRFTPGQLRVVSKLDFHRSRVLHQMLEGE